MKPYKREWSIPASGGRLGWPKRVLRAERKKRGDPNTFTTIDIEDLDFDGYEGGHIALPLPQARWLLERLPEAIAFAEGRALDAVEEK